MTISSTAAVQCSRMLGYPSLRKLCIIAGMACVQIVDKCLNLVRGDVTDKAHISCAKTNEMLIAIGYAASYGPPN